LTFYVIFLNGCSLYVKKDNDREEVEMIIFGSRRKTLRPASNSQVKDNKISSWKKSTLNNAPNNPNIR